MIFTNLYQKKSFSWARKPSLSPKDFKQPLETYPLVIKKVTFSKLFQKNTQFHKKYHQPKQQHLPHDDVRRSWLCWYVVEKLKTKKFKRRLLVLMEDKQLLGLPSTALRAFLSFSTKCMCFSQNDLSRKPSLRVGRSSVDVIECCLVERHMPQRPADLWFSGLTSTVNASAATPKSLPWDWRAFVVTRAKQTAG